MEGKRDQQMLGKPLSDSKGIIQMQRPMQLRAASVQSKVGRWGGLE